MHQMHICLSSITSDPPCMQPTAVALVLQDRLPWGTSHAESATLPIALLTAIVRKEALLPDLTAAFAATQLLPAISDALCRHFNSTPGQLYCPHLCKEFLVRAGFHKAAQAHDIPSRHEHEALNILEPTCNTACPTAATQYT